tara:strand:- start:492 stop:1175 length:684 start_codon:yes stop_codon:yes gene_type:complete
MKKKILLFEPSNHLRKALFDQISMVQSFEIFDAFRPEDIILQNKNSTFDLIIIGTDNEAHSFSLINQSIQGTQLNSKILFMVDPSNSISSDFDESLAPNYYIKKPFRVQNLIKKISAILAKISTNIDVAHNIGPFLFYPIKKIVILGDQVKIELTEKEVDILKCLINSGEEYVDREKLLKQVWNYNSDITTHTLETHIYRLRQKLEIDPSIPRLIISKGGGFAIRSI